MGIVRPPSPWPRWNHSSGKPGVKGRANGLRGAGNLLRGRCTGQPPWAQPGYRAGRSRAAAAFPAKPPVPPVSLVTIYFALTLRSIAAFSSREKGPWFHQEKYDLVIDATHPYAAEVTENIANACRETETAYLRLLRGAEDAPEDAVLVLHCAASPRSAPGKRDPA